MTLRKRYDRVLRAIQGAVQRKPQSLLDERGECDAAAGGFLSGTFHERFVQTYRGSHMSKHIEHMSVCQNTFWEQRVGSSNLSAPIISLPVHCGQIGDESFREHGSHRDFDRMICAFSSFCFVVEEPQLVVHARHRPDQVGDFADAHLGAGGNLAEIDLAFADAKMRTRTVMMSVRSWKAYSGSGRLW